MARHFPEKAALVVMISALAAGILQAHRPIETAGFHGVWTQAKAVENPEISQVIYREIKPDEPALWLSFTAAAGQEIFFSLGMPKIPGREGLRPALAVVGAGFPVDAPLPVELPPGTGALLLEPSGPPREFHEPFTGTDSYILVERTVRFDTAGTYYVVAFLPEMDPPAGKLWVSIGQAEQWGLEDIFRYPAIVDAVRAFHEVEPAPWWIPITIGIGIVIGGGILIGLGAAGKL